MKIRVFKDKDDAAVASDLTCVPRPLAVDWQGLRTASLDGDRAIPELILADDGDRFTIQIPALTKSLIESIAYGAKERKIPRFQRSEAMIAGWCAERSLMGYDLTKEEELLHWRRRTTLFDAVPYKVSESQSGQKFFVRLSSAYRLQVNVIKAVGRQIFRCKVYDGWVMARMVAIALTDPPASTTEAA